MSVPDDSGENSIISLIICRKWVRPFLGGMNISTLSLKSRAPTLSLLSIAENDRTAAISAISSRFVRTLVPNAPDRLTSTRSTTVSSLSSTKTYLKINDYSRLRELFATLLAEIQRIKSEGDLEAARNIVETYGVKLNPELHKEILDRYEHLNIAPYKGFLNPKLTLVKDGDTIKDVVVSYDETLDEQMLRYSDKYSVKGKE